MMMCAFCHILNFLPYVFLGIYMEVILSERPSVLVNSQIESHVVYPKTSCHLLMCRILDYCNTATEIRTWGDKLPCYVFVIFLFIIIIFKLLFAWILWIVFVLFKYD